MVTRNVLSASDLLDLRAKVHSCKIISHLIGLIAKMATTCTLA